MNELLLIFLYLLGITQGVVFGFVQWAPDSATKRSFVNGLTLKFLWGRK
jgi:hypothetical protein